MKRVALLCLALAACAPRAAPPRADDTVSAHEVVDLDLTPRTGDVWAFDVDVTGEVTTGGARLVACALHVSGEGRDTEVPVSLASATRFHARVPLAERENLVDVACRDGAGVVHRSGRARFVGRREDMPAARITAARDASGALVLEADTSTARAPIRSLSWSGVASGEGPRAVARDPGLVRLHVEDARGRSSETAARIDATDGVLALVDGAAPRRTGEVGVVYGIYPPLYGSPGLRAVTEKLPALADLGVDVLWITPPYGSPRGDFGYAVTNHFHVRQELGTDEDLAMLVDRAHRLGLRVVLDFVPNHTSDQHPWFVEAQKLGPHTHAHGFFARDEARQPTHYFDWKNLPNLAYDHPEVRTFVTAASSHWLRRTGADGFRVDAVWGLQKRAPDFVPEWVRSVRAENPDALLFAEASARDPFWLESGFDAAYDWTDDLGRWAWEEVWKEPSGIPDRLDAALLASRTRTGELAQKRVLRFLDNNDTGKRFVTKHGPGTTRAALAALFTTPGTPMLFAGSETGAEYEPYGQRPVLGDADPHALRALVKELVALRRARPALRGATLERVIARDAVTGKPAEDVYAFRRKDAASGDEVLVAIRFGERKSPVRIDRGSHTGPFRELRSGRALRAEGRDVRVELGAWDAAIVTGSGSRPPTPWRR